MATTALPSPRTSTASKIIPPSQNTAPVLEFRCLYTSDIRRKQKRWQDGKLRFHTFNKRVMVYDERSNFVGDTHWREDNSFDEGEEVELERNGILVQVSECVGRREQDLSELLDKRLKEREERIAARAVISSPPRPPSFHYRLQAPTIPLVDTISQSQPKRRRLIDASSAQKNGYAQNLTGATLTLSGRSINIGPRRLGPILAPVPKLLQDVVNVDLTGDDLTGDDRCRKDFTTYNGTSAQQSNPRSRRENPPPARNGYAQNITGAVLTLSNQGLGRPAVASIRSTSTSANLCIVPVSPGIVEDAHEKVAAPGAHEGDNYSYNDNGSTPQVEKQNQRHLPTTIISPNVTAEVPQINLPSNVSRRVLLAKPRKSNFEDVLPLSNGNCQPSKPLRLKSRPKKKLLSMSAPHNDASPLTNSLQGLATPTLVCPAVEPRFGDSQILHTDRDPEYILQRQEICPDARMGKIDISSRGCDGEKHSSFQNRLSESIRSGISQAAETTIRYQSLLETTPWQDDIQNPREDHDDIMEGAHPMLDPGILPSPVDSGIDHLAIDDILSRRASTATRNKRQTSPKLNDMTPTVFQEKGKAFPEAGLLHRGNGSANSPSSCSLVEVSKVMSLTTTKENHYVEDKRENTGRSTINREKLTTRTSIAERLSPQVNKLFDMSAHDTVVIKLVANGGNDTRGTERHADSVPNVFGTSEKERLHQPNKIPNPATRGRKAALQGDAAGKVPETVVPPVLPMAPPPKHLAKSGSLDRVEEASTKSYPTLSKDRDTGPWSREAYDLFNWRPNTVNN